MRRAMHALMRCFYMRVSAFCAMSYAERRAAAPPLRLSREARQPCRYAKIASDV